MADVKTRDLLVGEVGRKIHPQPKWLSPPPFAEAAFPNKQLSSTELIGIGLTPTGRGGSNISTDFIGGRANQWYPSLYEVTTPVEVKKTPEEDYHFMEDMTDKAINWIGQQKALIPKKAIFRLFRARCDLCPPPRPEGMGGQVQRQVRPGLG